VRLLVTGGAGFIGSNFVHYWLERHPQDSVVVYDLLTYAGNRESLAAVESGIEFIQGDICDRDLAEATLREHETEIVVNFAAESHNSLAVVDPTRFFRTNVLGTQTMLDASRAAGVARFHHVSTCEVYGDLALDTDEVFTEDSPAHAVQRVEGRRRPCRPGVLRDLRPSSNNHELLEQLRPFPVSREGRPALHDERARRRAAPDVCVDAEQARVAARARPL
jgi:nucleoside-diphosphate-sugar epimerase